jgi:hypothetical protein
MTGWMKKLLQAIEFETRIDKDGRIHLPSQYQHLYGTAVRLRLLLTEPQAPPKRRQPGSAKGVLKILVEDDEHLDGFEPYGAERKEGEAKQ